MRSVVSMALVASLALAGACAKNDTLAPAAADAKPVAEEASSTEQSITPEQLGELAANIEKQPDRAQDLLSERGISDAQFEAEIRKVSESPEASKRYAEAYKKAKA